MSHGEPRAAGRDAGLTIALAVLLADDRRAFGRNVFTKTDMKRCAKTVVNGFARLDNGMMFPRITGASRSPASSLWWIPLTLPAVPTGMKTGVGISE